MEFEIEDQAESQCFMGFGVCKGTHDYFGGRSAMAAAEAWMLSTQSGKFYSNEGESKQFLSGMGTDPFYPGDDAVTLRSVRPRVGDKGDGQGLRLRGGAPKTLPDSSLEYFKSSMLAPTQVLLNLVQEGDSVLDLERLLLIQEIIVARKEALAAVGALVNVPFRYKRNTGLIPRAREEVEVSLIGSWSDWLEVERMRLSEDGAWWEKEVALPPGKHSFKFLQDGEWRLTEEWPVEPDAVGEGMNWREVVAGAEGHAQRKRGLQQTRKKQREIESAMAILDQKIKEKDPDGSKRIAIRERIALSMEIGRAHV